MKEKIEILEYNIRDLFVWICGYLAAHKDENSHEFIKEAREGILKFIEELKSESGES